MKLTLLAAAAILALGSSSLFAKPVDLSEFKGTYNGTTSLFYMGTSYAGTSVMTFKVPKNGRSGNLSVNANISSGGSAADVSNNFNFASNKVLTISRLAPLIVDTPVSGSYSVKKQTTINGTGSPGMGVTTTLFTKVKRTAKRAKLTAVYSVFSGGVLAYQTTYIGSRRLKR
jgi:hypothetical protein